jgi:hypothetical protein
MSDTTALTWRGTRVLDGELPAPLRAARTDRTHNPRLMEKEIDFNMVLWKFFRCRQSIPACDALHVLYILEESEGLILQTDFGFRRRSGLKNVLRKVTTVSIA